MPNFAVLDGESVINIIVADSKEIAESLTGKDCVEATSVKAQVGGTYSEGNFIEPKPYPSWVLDENYEWNPPVAPPVPDLENPKFYEWNENSLEWILIQD
jgi:hypothetical protein